MRHGGATFLYKSKLRARSPNAQCLMLQSESVTRRRDGRLWLWKVSSVPFPLAAVWPSIKRNTRASCCCAVTRKSYTIILQLQNKMRHSACLKPIECLKMTRLDDELREIDHEQQMVIYQPKESYRINQPRRQEKIAERSWNTLLVFWLWVTLKHNSNSKSATCRSSLLSDTRYITLTHASCNTN